MHDVALARRRDVCHAGNGGEHRRRRDRDRLEKTSGREEQQTTAQCDDGDREREFTRASENHTRVSARARRYRTASGSFATIVPSSETPAAIS